MSPYLDDALPDGEKAALAAHLDRCPACAARLAGLAAAGQRLAGMTRLAAPVGFAGRVMAGLTKTTRHSPFSLFLVRGAGVALAMLVIGFGILFGRALDAGLKGPQPAAEVSFFSLSHFEPAPPDSLGGAYLAMLETGHGQ